MTRKRTARRGVTLIEVLTAIFIMAIGLMALLTLFPLGALSMAQAIKDDRSGSASRSAEAMFRSYWRYAVTNNPPDNDLYPAMMDPDGAGPMPSRDPTTTPTVGPSYPVFVDGFGWLQNGAGMVGGRIPRRALGRAITNLAPGSTLQQQAVLTYFSSPDDITLSPDGVPSPTVERERRYSWAYLVRQLDVRKPRDLELTVVLYANRPLMLTNNLSVGGETAYAANFTKGVNTVTLTWNTATEEKPAIRRGGWILDATMPMVANSPVVPRGYFYRVVNVTDGSSTMELELDMPARAGDGTATSTAIVLEGVVEVFDRGVVAE